MPVDPNLVGNFLEQKIQQRAVTNYGEVALHFGLPEFNGAWAAHPLSEIFEVIDQQDANANRPFRTSIVISATTNSPGAGFYEALVRLKNIKPVITKMRETVWMQELNAAYNYQW
jgi:hypothetical protein